MEIKCNPGFNIVGDNLISCNDQGSWDFDVENCQPGAIIEEIERTTSPSVTLNEFLKEFKDFLFFSCKTENRERPKLCSYYGSDFGSDLSLFELPETQEFEGMDAKLSRTLKNLLSSAKLEFITAGNFMTILLGNSQTNSLLSNSYRFVVCLYIDLIIADENSVSDGSGPIDNINENIKSLLKTVVLLIYKHQLKTFN